MIRQRTRKVKYYEHAHLSNSKILLNRCSCVGRLAVSSGLDVRLLASMGIYHRFSDSNQCNWRLPCTERPGSPCEAQEDGICGPEPDAKHYHIHCAAQYSRRTGIQRLRSSLCLVSCAAGDLSAWRYAGRTWP